MPPQSDPASPVLAIVVPVYHDDEALAGLLDELEILQGAESLDFELVVVDGAGSTGTEVVAGERARYYATEPGRGGQIAAGVFVTAAPWIWVVHADCRPTAEAWQELASYVGSNCPAWGRFQVRLAGLGLIAMMMNWRSRATHICTGDQAMFFHRSLLDTVGGFPAQPLMEDIEVSKRLKGTTGRFIAANAAVVASPRRWRSGGVLRTVLFMWWTRLRYFFGVSAQALFADYYRSRS